MKTITAVLIVALALAGCGGTTTQATTTTEHREANPVAQAQETLAKEYMHNEISEAQYYVGLALIKHEGEAAVCASQHEVFPENCNPDGSVK
jgi:uncharacterized protein YceK